MKTRPTFTLALTGALGICCGLEPWAVFADGVKSGSQQTAPSKPPNASPGANPAAKPVAPPVNAPAPASASATLQRAREKLTAQGVRSIKARIIERVAIDGRRLRLEGTYRQGVELRLKLELKVVPEAVESGVDGALLEVCDGTILWTRHQIGKVVQITRRDARKILEAARSNAEANVLAVELGLGGLPSLLASLEQSMTFDKLTQEEINGKKFTVVSGAWTAEILQKFKNNLGKRPTLPSHFPDAVRIYLEPEILFPRRIDFLKQGSDGDAEVLVELDFVDIVINGPLDRHEFDFEPPNGDRTLDVTADYLRQLKAGGAK